MSKTSKKYKIQVELEENDYKLLTKKADKIHQTRKRFAEITLSRFVNSEKEFKLITE